MASDSASGISSARLAGTPAEVFTRLLDLIVAQLAPENLAKLDVPSDELHQEILIPLLPAMLGDKAIRNHWREQKGHTFFSRLQSHMVGEAPQPGFAASDFEIHVTASYSAGADARALADTLLSEESLRDLAANLVNTLLGPAWSQLPVEEEVTPEEVEAPSELAPAAEEEVVPAATGAAVSESGDVAEPAHDMGEFVDEAPAAAPPRHPVRPPKVGFVVHAPPFRPQPWRTQHNPLVGTQAMSGFPNSLARNPLGHRSGRGGSSTP